MIHYSPSPVDATLIDDEESKLDDSQINILHQYTP